MPVSNQLDQMLNKMYEVLREHKKGLIMVNLLIYTEGSDEHSGFWATKKFDFGKHRLTVGTISKSKMTTGEKE